MEITPRELRDIEIHSEIRGYSRDEVNDLLERAAISIEASNQRVTQMQDRLTSAQGEAVRTRETEDILHRTLLLAQRAADEAVAEATAKSRQMLDEAETSSRRLVAESEAEARRKGEAERRRLEHEVVELAGRRDALLADVEALTRFEAEYRERMVRALETDLTSLRTRTTTAPGQRPETSDVEIPASAHAAILIDTNAEADDERADDAPADDVKANADAPNLAESSVDKPSLDQQSPAPGATGPSSSSAGGAEGSAGENGRGIFPTRRPDAEPQVPAQSRSESVNTATSEVDVRSLFEQSHDAPKLPSREPAPSPTSTPSPTAEAAPSAPLSPARAAGLRPIDLPGSDNADGDILDDDAFFATLRDAVHDEAPLGPREEGDDVTGENRFFDQDAERGTFRDVFRRRR
jgi:cell division septum initiation protein DivIVA